MDKYLSLVFICIAFGFAGLCGGFIIFNRMYKRLYQEIHKVAAVSDGATYHFAKFMTLMLQDKAKERDLTEEEKDLFHGARNVVLKIEDMVKRAKARKS